MSYFIYARKSRKDADLEALGIDVLERHITTLLELAKTLSLPIGAGDFLRGAAGDAGAGAGAAVP